MLFTKVGVYRADEDGSFIVELGHEAEDAVNPIYRSSPLPEDEVWNLLRHVQLSEDEIEEQLQRASAYAQAATAG